AVGWKSQGLAAGDGWNCVGEERDAVIFDGTTEVLREHVSAILAGRTTTITARAPAPWNQERGRLWRIKAGPDVRKFVLSDESPYFVGWGTGEPEEVKKLAQALRAPAVRDRIAAAADLADLGPAARPALPALRRSLRDSAPTVALAAATALARLDSDSDESIKVVENFLGHADAKVRTAAASALEGLGSRASAALPPLLTAPRDRHGAVRAAAADAVGPVATASPREAVTALNGLLKREKDEYPVNHAVWSLRCLGPCAWEAIPALRENWASRREEWDYYSARE